MELLPVGPLEYSALIPRAQVRRIAFQLSELLPRALELLGDSVQLCEPFDDFFVVAKQVNPTVDVYLRERR